MPLAMESLAMEPQARAFYNILLAVFDHVDANIEPKGLGLWTTEKEMEVLVLVGQPELAESLHVLNLRFYSKS